MALSAMACKRCGKLFNYFSGDKICPACKEAMEEKFQEVKHYIQDHKNATIAQVAEECDIQTTWIQKWLREERLELTEGSPITLGCENCGAPIRSGRLCNKCADSFRSAAGSYINANKPKQEENPFQHGDGAKMRFIQKD